MKSMEADEMRQDTSKLRAPQRAFTKFDKFK